VNPSDARCSREGRGAAWERFRDLKKARRELTDILSDEASGDDAEEHDGNPRRSQRTIKELIRAARRLRRENTRSWIAR